MADLGEPRLNQWYVRQDIGAKFLVTDYDADAATVEIQTEDGDLAELDQEVWQALPLSFSEAPYDWTVPIAALQLDDDGNPQAEADGNERRMRPLES